MRRVALLLLLAGCSGWQVRPFAEAELYEHDEGAGASGIAGGASFISDGGAVVDVGPAMRFDLLGGRTEEFFDNQAVGGVIRLRFVK